MVEISRATRKNLYGRTNRGDSNGNSQRWNVFRIIGVLWLLGWLFLYMLGGEEEDTSSSSNGNKNHEGRNSESVESMRNKVHELEKKVQKKVVKLEEKFQKNVVKMERKIQNKVENFIEEQEHFWMGDKGNHQPLVAVIVGQEEHQTMKSIENLLEYTNRDNIVGVCVFFGEEGMSDEEKDRISTQVRELDDGTTLHRHGLDYHSHAQNELDNHEHESKIHVIFEQNISPSVSKRRQHCVTFLDFLVQEHKGSGRMHEDQEVLLMFLRPDARLVHDDWIVPVTKALLPPTEKTASAISLTVEGQEGEKLSLDESFKALTILPSKDDESSSKTTYSTPLLLGPATIMTLNTYLNHLPLVGESQALDTYFTSDLELSLNLWLCANGIDVLKDVHVDLESFDQTFNTTHVASIDAAAYFLGTWVKATTKQDPEYYERLLSVIAARFGVPPALLRTDEDNSFQPFLLDSIADKCKSFSWFMDKINSNKKNSQNDEEKKKPLQPLRPLNLDLVKDVKQYTLEYVGVANDHKDHPHMGAKDENGNFGYVHDETALRLNPPKVDLPDDVQNQPICTNHEANYKMLTEKVFIDTTAHEAAERRAETNPQNNPRVKIFCAIYTISKYHEKLPAILGTWAPKCDGFMAASDKTIPELHTVDIVHEGPEAYENMYQKIRSIWAYIYDHYYDKYDYFHIGGDDLYILVENLRLYLESDEIRTATNGGIYLPEQPQKTANPIFLGRRFKENGNVNRIFNSGGAGYTLNKAALKALVVDAFPTCFPHLKTFAEDVMVASCLRKKIQVLPYDTKDDNGGERYMPFTPGHHYNYRLNPRDKNDWYPKYSIDIKYGTDHCAARSVAFHYIDPKLMRKMHAILYGYCSGAS